MIPFFWMFWASLMTEAELVQGIVQIIDKPTLGHYLRIFGVAETDALSGGQTKQLSLALLNSFIVAVPTAIISTAIAMLAGYAFGRFTFPGQRTLLFTLLLTRVLPPIAISPSDLPKRCAVDSSQHAFSYPPILARAILPEIHHPPERR